MANTAAPDSGLELLESRPKERTRDPEPNYALTLMGQRIEPEQFEQITEYVGAHQLEVVDTKTLSTTPQVTTLTLTGTNADKAINNISVDQLSRNTGLDIGLQWQGEERELPRLICFDMDSTLIQNEVMDEIAIVAGIGEPISKITESAMRGEITFRESFNQRLALLEGFPSERLPEIANKLRLSPGAKTVISTLRQLGVKIALFSGGFSYFAEGLQTALGPLDYIHANQLEIVDGKLTGKIVGDLVDEKKKAALIQSIAQDLNIGLQQTIAVGDGANDIPMLKLSGMGVAFRAKPVVREQSAFILNQLGLEGILYFLGIEQQAFAEP